MRDMTFSCSVGLAFARGGALSFRDLFEHADRALYRAKAAGKQQAVCYQDEMLNGLVGRPEEEAAVCRTEIDSDRLKQWNLPTLISRAFDIL